MIGSARVRCDLGDQFLENGVREGLVALRRHDKCAGTSDHMIVVIAVEIRLERENGQAVDAQARGNRLVAGEVCRAAAIVGAVAGQVDDAPVSSKWALCKQRAAIIDSAADGGAA